MTRRCLSPTMKLINVALFVRARLFQLCCARAPFFPFFTLPTPSKKEKNNRKNIVPHNPQAISNFKNGTAIARGTVSPTKGKTRYEKAFVYRQPCYTVCFHGTCSRFVFASSCVFFFLLGRFSNEHLFEIYFFLGLPLDFPSMLLIWFLVREIRKIVEKVCGNDFRLNMFSIPSGKIG